MRPQRDRAAPFRCLAPPPDFGDWQGLLDHLRECFADMSGRIDPPSSLDRMDAADLERKARREVLILVLQGDDIAGCGFAEEREADLYLSKIAVRKRSRGQGLLRMIIGAAERLAVAAGKPALALQTRIELVENRRMFEAVGFAKTGETRHPGYDRPTSIAMTKRLA